MLRTKSNGKATSTRWRFFLRALLVCAFLTPAILTQISPAGFSTGDVYTHVEIDGVDYGAFDKIEGLDELLENGAKPGEFGMVTLKREFVTDPSLYLWAKNMTSARSDLKDVHIVMENRDGEEINRYVLRFVQPLSWTVEAANPSLGGFSEKVDLAVQEVSVH